MTKLKECINAIIENNRINDGKWSDWPKARHVFDVYNIKADEHFSFDVDALNVLILKADDYPEYIEHFLKTIHLLEV